MNKKLFMSLFSLLVVVSFNSHNINASMINKFNGTNIYDDFCKKNDENHQTCQSFYEYKNIALNEKVSSFVADYINTYDGKFVGKHGELGKKVYWTQPYIGQCASLVKYYLALYGFEYDDNSYGDAKDYVNLKNSVIVDDPQDGDLVIWTGGKYGHIGIYYQGKVFNQNPHAAKLYPLSKYKKLGTPIFVRPNYKLF